MEEGKDFLKPKDIEGLSPTEAYWRGRCEKSEEENKKPLEILKNQLWHTSTDKLLRGSIGAGSTIIYGTNPKIIIGTAFGAGGVVFGIASLFLPVSIIGTAVSFTIGIMGIIIALGERIFKRTPKNRG